ncbi:hypothetical protein LNKW23_25190 [Paralimibaculum aggregatum]|uniref:DUF805 domain-containing protein n=1 Tax=Paralimibaculum aggregatum TaxID=3036245 RepID=A0ABQ6LLJ3_9RHOB|nr:DUF805 domain-containing protein [Limibaculum sp. NKW23]GMG83306.1 hypothetical protein LNKW23_25190 [Limibaculum sp. NKW23]
MDFAGAVSTCFAKYATFSGRASRPEFWYFVLFIVLVSIALMILDRWFFAVPYGENGPLGAVFNIAILLPNLAVSWRRLHDTGRSGLWNFLPLAGAPVMILAGVGGAPALAYLGFGIGAVGLVTVLVWYASRGEDRPNAFGPPPR